MHSTGFNEPAIPGKSPVARVPIPEGGVVLHKHDGPALEYPTSWQQFYCMRGWVADMLAETERELDQITRDRVQRKIAAAEDIRAIQEHEVRLNIQKESLAGMLGDLDYFGLTEMHKFLDKIPFPEEEKEEETDARTDSTSETSEP